MSTKSQLTTDWNDSLNSLLGKNVKIFFKTLVRLETRGEKTKAENRVLVFCSSRMFVLTVKIPARVEAHYHYLEIEALESRQPNHLCFIFDGDTKPLSLLIGDEVEGNTRVIGAVCALAGVLGRLCPGAPFSQIISKISVPGALEATERENNVSAIAGGPCGGFSAQYAAACDLLQVPFREDVAWDIDTMYHTHNQRILMLRDFEHLEQKELSALICALQYNRWFRGIAGAGESCNAPLNLVAGAIRRGCLRELRWPRSSLRYEGASKFASAIASAASLHTIDLTENPIEDKGAIVILHALASNENGIKHVCFSRCGITGKAANILGATLCDNANNLESLTHLDLSHNNLKDDIHDLCNFLAQPNVLTHLNLSHTDITLENIFGALLRGCSAKLCWLSLAGNPWSSRRGTRDPPPSLRQFFTACLALNHLDLSHCRLPQDALKNVLLGLACNEVAAGLTLVLRGVLATGGHLVLESCLPGVRCLTNLDLSENCMEGEFSGVMSAIGKTKSLRGLVIARLQGRRQTSAPVVQALVEVLQDQEATLSSLDISDCKLKATLLPLLGALGVARGLSRLDISGNGVGDPGARLLARALRLNTSLKHLTIDRNHLTHKGVAELAQALQYNRTLQKMEFPVADVVTSGKGALERLEPFWRQIEEHLLRNASTDVFPVNSIVEEEELTRCVLPASPVPRLVDTMTDILHAGLLHYMHACAEAARDQVNGSESTTAAIIKRMSPPRSAIHRVLNRALHPLSTQLTEACNAVVRNVYDDVLGGDIHDQGINGEDGMRRSRLIQFPPPPLPPHSHATATPLGGRRVSETSGSLCERPQSAAGGPPARCSPDSLADLPSNQQQLHHLVKGRPRRTKTRAPSRPVPDSHSYPTTDEVDVFWRGCASPTSPRSSPTSPTSPTSLTLHNDDTMCSLTSGESTPVAQDERSEAEVKRTHSAESPSLAAPISAIDANNTSISPKASSPHVENEEPKLNHQNSTDSCITEGLENCVGGSILGISPASLTGSMRKETPLTVEESG